MEKRSLGPIDAATAAYFLGVSQSTIRQWVRRGKLRRCGTGPNRRALFDIEDLLKVHGGDDCKSA